MKMKLIDFFKCVLVLTVLMTFLGCAATSGTFGRLEYNERVKQTFESFTVPEGYAFYYYGSQTFPKAFMGISKEYRLESTLWNPIDLTPEILHSWIWGHANRLQGDLRRFGSNIIGPQGEHIGVYYSLKEWQQWVRVEILDDNVISLGGPIVHPTARWRSRYPY